MKIGITGDTHGHIQAIRKLLLCVEPVDYWFHTGDYSQDSRILSQETKLPVLAVQGNCDPALNKANVDEFITLEDRRIWLTHGHKYMRGYNEEELAWWGKKLETDIVVFGHTHVPFVKWFGEILLVNPGSLVLPRGDKGPTYGIMTLKKGQKPTVEIKELDNK